MDPKERAEALQSALRGYEQSSSRFYDEVVAEVAERASQNGSLGKADIGALVAWKRLNASTRWMRDFMSVADRDVRDATTKARQAALDTESDTPSAASHARSALTPVPGFKRGDALASAVIYALAPDRMAVYDRRAQLGLESIGLALTARPGRYGRYMALVEQVMREVEQHGTSISPREVDLALFTLGGPAA